MLWIRDQKTYLAGMVWVALRDLRAGAVRATCYRSRPFATASRAHLPWGIWERAARATSRQALARGASDERAVSRNGLGVHKAAGRPWECVNEAPLHVRIVSKDRHPHRPKASRSCDIDDAST